MSSMVTSRLNRAARSGLIRSDLDENQWKLVLGDRLLTYKAKETQKYLLIAYYIINMRFASFEISGKGFIVGLVILLLSFAPIASLSTMSIVGGEILGLSIPEFLFVVSWIMVPIMMILAGLSASYIGKYLKLSNGIITSIVLSISYFVIVLALQSFLIPALSGGEIPGIGTEMELTIPTQIYYSSIVYSFIQALVFLIVGGIVGVFLFKRKLRVKGEPNNT